MKLLEKIEELTLYAIQQEDLIQGIGILKLELESQRKEIEKLKVLIKSPSK